MNRGTKVSGLIWLMLFAVASSPRISAQISTGSASGQGTQVAADSAPRTVRGTVVDSVTGEPIYRALVQIGGQYATLTDHDGHFEFNRVTLSGIPPWAMKPGYFSSDRFNRFMLPALEASPTQSAPEFTVKLVPEAIVSGTVTGQDGNPIEGIPVQLKTLITQEGLARWRPRMQTRTNAEGQYRFAELEAGKYIVTTGFHIEGLADSQAASGYIPARYPPPGGGSSTSETAMVLKPGDHAVADLSPDMEKLFPVTGTIAGYGERAGVGFRALTASGEEFSPTARFTPRTGEFRIMLPGGSYRVTATAYIRQGPMEATREVTVPQAPVGGVSFTMEPYASIPVEIEVDTIDQSASGSGQAGAVPPDNFAGNISLTSANGEGFTPFLSARPLHRTGDEQSSPLIIDNVSPGRYVLRANLPMPWHVASASCGGVDLMHDELVVGGGSVGCSIRIVLRNDSGLVHITIRGAENSDSGSSNLVVYLLPLGDLVGEPVIASGWSPGYEGSNVAPGRYLVLAMDHHEELPYRDAEAMRRYAEMGQEVVVTANGKVDAEISLCEGHTMKSHFALRASLTAALSIGVAWAQQAAPRQPQPRAATAATYRISGKVVDAHSGAALGRASVRIAEVKERSESNTLTTGEDGSFSFDGLPQGKYSLSAVRHGYIEQSYEEHDQYSTAIAVGPGLTSEGLIFKLSAEGIISGTITDEAGEPVRNAQVRLFQDEDTNGLRATRQRETVNTDDRGVYELSNLRPGAYFLVVTAHPWYSQRLRQQQASAQGTDESQSQNLDVAYPTTYYPGIKRPGRSHSDSHQGRRPA